MIPEKIIETLHPLERKVLPVIKETGAFDMLVAKTRLQKVEVMRALQWLQNKKIIRIQQKLEENISLDDNGKRYRETGLPEKTFLESLSGETALDAIKKKTGLSTEEINICLGLLKRNQAIMISKGKNVMVSITKQGESLLKQGFPEASFIGSMFPIASSKLSKEEKLTVERLKKRKRLLKFTITKIITASLTESGKKIVTHGISDAHVIDRITPSILKSGDWKKKTLRKYDVTINVPQISGGRRHFVNQAVDYIKRIWLDMGFREMDGNYVQTTFWDFDSLFVPQDHPARDEHDTFFIKDPAAGTLPNELAKRVKAAHENGWTTGSKGWAYRWSDKIAMENLLRTHTTVLSAQYISQLKKEDLPTKFFSVNRVFRNETLGWKSLFEFTQVEGIVVDPNADFRHLQGYLKEFFAKMGFPDVRIRPAHFPYTEPSAEVDVWHPIKKQWMELGGSGLFRPEMVKPLLGFECPVLAWGLGMERSIMEYYQLKDIRDIYKNDLKQLREMKIWMR